jgi:hypothetical protein
LQIELDKSQRLENVNDKFMAQSTCTKCHKQHCSCSQKVGSGKPSSSPYNQKQANSGCRM